MVSEDCDRVGFCFTLPPILCIYIYLLLPIPLQRGTGSSIIYIYD